MNTCTFELMSFFPDLDFFRDPPSYLSMLAGKTCLPFKRFKQFKRFNGRFLQMSYKFVAAGR